MKRCIGVFVLSLCLIGIMMIGNTARSSAAAAPCSKSTNPLACACETSGGAGSSSTACGTDGSDPISGPGGVLEKVTLILATISGVAAVIIIIISGFSMVTSSGDSQRVANARNAIVGSIIGLVLIAAAAGLITFVINKI